MSKKIVDKEGQEYYEADGSNVQFDLLTEDSTFTAYSNGVEWTSDDGETWKGKGLSESQNKISMICDSIKDLLLYKNEKYGDSALHPNNIFYKGDSSNSIKIRLDDKIGRIMNCDETRVNDVADIIGYCVLLLVSMNVTDEEIKKFKD